MLLAGSSSIKLATPLCNIAYFINFKIHWATILKKLYHGRLKQDFELATGTIDTVMVMFIKIHRN